MAGDYRNHNIIDDDADDDDDDDDAAGHGDGRNTDHVDHEDKGYSDNHFVLLLLCHCDDSIRSCKVFVLW